MEKIIIAAVSKNNVIGNGNKIPWSIKEDLQFFKETTIGYPIIMGKKTFLSIGKPLTDRFNYVLSHIKEPFIAFDGYAFVNSIDYAFQLCEKKKPKKVFIIGGAEVFEKTINVCDKLIISRINEEYEGDKSFPNIDLQKWKMYKTEKRELFNIEYFKRNQ